MKFPIHVVRTLVLSLNNERLWGLHGDLHVLMNFAAWRYLTKAWFLGNRGNSLASLFLKGQPSCSHTHAWHSTASHSPCFLRSLCYYSCQVEVVKSYCTYFWVAWSKDSMAKMQDICRHNGFFGLIPLIQLAWIRVGSHIIFFGKKQLPQDLKYWFPPKNHTISPERRVWRQMII